MSHSILISPADSEESTVYVARRDRFQTKAPTKVREWSVRFGPSVVSTSGSAVVMTRKMHRLDFIIVSEEMLEQIQDEIDYQDAMNALEEAREKGTISLAAA